MTHILRIFGTLALLGMLATFGPANAAQIQLNTGVTPSLCAVVEGGNTAPGTPVIAYPCSGGPEDQWSFNGNQFLGIGTANGTSMCLDVAGIGESAGELVVLNPCGGSETQQWQVDPSGGGYGPAGRALIFNESSVGFGGPAYCLDSSGGPSVGGGTQLVINNCTAGTSQNWIVRGMQLQVASNGPYVCANVKGNDTANGTPVIAYSCNDAPNELWNYLNGQIQGIGTENGTSKCLTAAGSTAGSLVYLSTCTGGQNQQWALAAAEFLNGDITPNSGDPWTICLDSSGGPSVGGGTQLVLNACGATSQNWNVR